MKKQAKLVMTMAGAGILSLLVWGNNVGVVWADDEQVLEKKATALNSATASSRHDEARVKALAKQFNVPESRVTELRNQKMGWGEVTISLAMAEHLSATSKTPLTTEQALKKIEQLRGEKMGWGKIAQELGFKLGPVISKVERSETSVKTADREATEKLDHKAKGDRPEKAERGDKADRPDKVDRAERPERMERAERSARPERPGR